MVSLKNCWEIKECGRENGGSKEKELGECIASRENLGHHCWAIAGTLCGGEVQGTSAQKQDTCMNCEVYKMYHPITGREGDLAEEYYSDERGRYQALMHERFVERAKR